MKFARFPGCVPALLLAPLIAAALFLPRLVISDGAFYQHARLALQLNDVSLSEWGLLLRGCSGELCPMI